MFQSKTEIAKELVKSGKYQKAMKIMKTWKYISKDISNRIKLALSSKLSPEFYISIKQNPEKNYQSGIDAVIEFFNNKKK